jgi:hypothetical protein
LQNAVLVSALVAGALVVAASQPALAQKLHSHAPGLGVVLTSKNGQIFGFDIDRFGDTGVLATQATVETFDQDTGKIIKSFGKFFNQDSDYVVNGIAAGSVALIEQERVPDGQIFPKRTYKVMNPVTANKFTGKWTPPSKGIIMQAMSDDQASSVTSLFALTSLDVGEVPTIFVSDIASNTFTNVITLDDSFTGGTLPQYAQWTRGNKAVIALSPDGGAVGGVPPVTYLIDLSTGEKTSFRGYNNGPFHAGSVNGLAVDPRTGVAATTTELNAQVEFYNLRKMRPIAFAQLPCSGNADQLLSGTSITNDPINKLFLVTEPNYCDGSQGSAIVVYDETGAFVEAITGFNVPHDVALGVAPRINPHKRMGWIFGGPNGTAQLQQFFY